VKWNIRLIQEKIGLNTAGTYIIYLFYILNRKKNLLQLKNTKVQKMYLFLFI